MVLPSKDTNTPVHDLEPEAEAVALRILKDLEVPQRVRFTPAQLAEDVGVGTPRSWQRACQLGIIEAVHFPGGYLISWRALVAYVAEHQNVSMN
jgi:hypothetical protein